MDESDFIVPEKHLPRGIAERIDDPPAVPAVARPAATVVLMRDAAAGLEVLLLKRVHNAGFVPGAYVFPGGRVDRGDADPAILRLTLSLTPEGAARRMGLRQADPPAAAYYLAALREAFEETGILVGRGRGGDPLPTAAVAPTVLDARNRILDEVCSFYQALEELGARLDDAAMEYIGHWITPIEEPRRYDARFFAAAVAPDAEPAIHAAEVLEAIWVRPIEALRRTRDGSLPMVFPTVKTLESMTPFATTAEVLGAFRERSVPSVLPRLIRTADGIRLRIPEIISDSD